MPDITIPDAAVEAAARNMFYLRATEPDESVPCRDTDWDSLPDSWQEEWRDGAHAALAAAAPLIAAQALRDAAEAWQINGWVEGDLPPRGSTRPVLIIGMAQRACDFIRDRADQIEAEHG